ncbi:hypothetical protein, partial [Streptomyces alkaliphilus]|uniref:hypothetical protein n=1 Tax=Streptomyces alkaliphilus TaxID=1472722 RepID=UPI0015FCE38C
PPTRPVPFEPCECRPPGSGSGTRRYLGGALRAVVDLRREEWGTRVLLDGGVTLVPRESAPVPVYRFLPCPDVS